MHWPGLLRCTPCECATAIRRAARRVSALVIGFIVLMVSVFFVDNLVIYSVWNTNNVAVQTALLFSIGGFINALLARKFDDVSIIPTFVLTPMTYLGGVFYSITLLPPPWETVSRFNPIVYVVNAFRYGLLRDELSPQYIDINIEIAFGVIVLFIIGLFSTAMWMLNRGVGLRQ